MDNDDYLFERFEIRDWREEGRIVKITGFALTDYRGRRRYVAECVANPNNPSRVGKSTIISKHILDAKWRKVSH